MVRTAFKLPFRQTEGLIASVMVLMALTQPLESGPYKVIWHALSTDGHRTQGTYHFNVAH